MRWPTAACASSPIPTTRLRRGLNQGAADSRAPWLAFVNPDCLVEADSLVRMRAHAHAAMGFDAAGPRDPGDDPEAAWRGKRGMPCSAPT